MTRLERLEMGVVAAFGVGIGFMLSRAMHWPWWVSIPLCVLAAGASYRPMEILGRVRDGLAPWMTDSLARDVGHWAFMGLSWIAYVALGWIVAMASFGAVLAYPMMLDGSLARKPGEMIFLGAFMGTLVGGIMLAFGSISGMWFRDIQRKPKRYKKPSWALPLSRRMPRVLMPTRHWYLRGTHRSLWWRVACVTWKVPVAQALGIWMFAVFVIDAFLTVCIAAATTRRMAVMASAFAGAVVGTLLGLRGDVDPGTALVAGMGIGGCCGYFWHPLAMALKRTRWDSVPAPVLEAGCF